VTQHDQFEDVTLNEGQTCSKHNGENESAHIVALTYLLKVLRGVKSHLRYVAAKQCFCDAKLFDELAFGTTGSSYRIYIERRALSCLVRIAPTISTIASPSSEVYELRVKIN